MPTNKKPRKPYRPRKALVRPMVYGIDTESRVNLQLTPHVVLEAFRTGAGDESGWHTLTGMLNVGAVLSRKHPEDVQAIMSRGLDAVVEVKERGLKTGAWGVSGDQFRALADALTLASDLQDTHTRREIRDAINITLATATE